MSSLAHLPVDVLSLLFEHLGADVRTLSRLSRCCRALHAIVESHGWPRLAAKYPLQSSSLAKATRRWRARDLIRFGRAVDQAWLDVDAVLIQLGPTWSKQALPLLALDRGQARLHFATGPHLHSCGFDDRGKPYQLFDRPQKIGRGAFDDVTSLCIADTGELLTGTVTGLLQRHRITQRLDTAVTYTPHPSLQGSRSAVQGIASRDGLLAAILTPRAGSRAGMVAEARGHVSLHTLQERHQTPISVPLADKPWSIHLLAGQIAIGGNGISLYTLDSGSVRAAPRLLVGPQYRSAVYAFATVPGLSPDILLSGWYDGVLRLHDLRVPVTTPQLECSDRWSEDAIYSLAASSQSRILCGTSRHSAIRFADLRVPTSVHTTLYVSGDSSPVYSLATEASRIFAVTDRRAIMVDFKPGMVEGYWGKPPRWADGARPKFSRLEERLCIKTFGVPDEQSARSRRRL